MSRKTPYFTSTDIIESVKRRISIPISQNTFDEEDILLFANEELVMNQVPSVMQFNEEFFVTHVDVPLVTGTLNYQIPDRAIGRKFRDIYLVDSNGNENEMANILIEDKNSFQNSGSNSDYDKFYMKGDDVVLITSPQSTLSGSIRFYYYLRPNQLVLNERAAICTSFVKTITVVNADIVAGDIITIGSTEFIAGTDFAIGGSSIITATNLVAAINAENIGTAANGSPSTAVVQFNYNDLSTEITTDNEDAFIIQSTQGIEFDQVPTHMEELTCVDFLQTKKGHKSLAMTVQIPANAVSETVINFATADVPSNFIVGDYICSEYECIIPQLPDDVHPVLVERVCNQILSSIGDVNGVKVKMESLKELEGRQGTLLDNRTEGAPKKMNNIKSLLRLGKRGRWR